MTRGKVDGTTFAFDDSPDGFRVLAVGNLLSSWDELSLSASEPLRATLHRSGQAPVVAAIGPEPSRPFNGALDAGHRVSLCSLAADAERAEVELTHTGGPNAALIVLAYDYASIARC